MPHQRSRGILPVLLKRLKLFPVVGVLGSRQTGKSTLLRDLLSKEVPLRYLTLDREEVRVLAQRQPTLFIQNLEAPETQTICIDEIQKVSALFDTIKAEVDIKRRPGKFAISGSTEFTKKTGVRESLTGRVSLLRLFPLNLSEIKETRKSYPLIDPVKILKKTVPSELKLSDVHAWFERGGMPGIFAVRDEASRQTLFESWIETTCTRDLAQFKIPRFNPDLARRIFFETARIEVADRPAISQAVGKLPRQIEAYLQAFKSLFVLYEIEPHPQSVGKPRFYIFDAGVAKFAGADIATRRKIWFLNECFSQFSYAGQIHPDVFFYRTRRGSEVDFVVSATSGGKRTSYAIKITDEEVPSTYSLRSVIAFGQKKNTMPVLILAPCSSVQKLSSRIHLVPWNLIV